MHTEKKIVKITLFCIVLKKICYLSLYKNRAEFYFNFLSLFLEFSIIDCYDTFFISLMQ